MWRHVRRDVWFCSQALHTHPPPVQPINKLKEKSDRPKLSRPNSRLKSASNVYLTWRTIGTQFNAKYASVSSTSFTRYRYLASRNNFDKFHQENCSQNKSKNMGNTVVPSRNSMWHGLDSPEIRFVRGETAKSDGLTTYSKQRVHSGWLFLYAHLNQSTHLSIQIVRRSIHI